MNRKGAIQRQACPEKSLANYGALLLGFFWNDEQLQSFRPAENRY